MENILVVGSGLTGALTASILRNKLPTTSRISVWEKDNDVGGRCSTVRGPDELNSIVDLGAQFIASMPQTYQAHQSFYDEMLANGILKAAVDPPTEFGPTSKFFVTPAGMKSMIKFYLDKSGAEVKCNQGVSSIDREGNKWTVSTEGGASSQFDCLVVTIPVPQMLELSGSVRAIIDSKPEVKQRLEKVEYNSRFALGMFYKPGTDINVPWQRKNFPDDSCLKLVLVDTKKRGVESPGVGPSVCVHTNDVFSLQHLEEDAEAVCKEHVFPRVQQLVPQFPHPDSVTSHKWRYGSATKSYEGNPGAVVLHDEPLLILGGDAFSNSGLDNCMDGALALSEEVIKRIA